MRALFLAISLTGCYGMSFNPKAEMCLDPNFTDDQDQGIISAGEEWHEVTNGDVYFHFHIGHDNCEVELKAVPNLEEDNQSLLGATDPYFNYIKFDTEGKLVAPNGATSFITQYSLRETALHEFGHYLTGDQHSPNRQDIMFASGREHVLSNGQVMPDRHLTANDIARWTAHPDHSYYQRPDKYPME